MARQAKRTRPGDVANAFIRCFLSDAAEWAGGLLTDKQWLDTLEYFEYRCVYADQPISLKEAVKDHAIPINKEHCGLHLYGNVLPCTAEANADKGAKPYHEFVRDPNRRQKIEAF